MRIAYLTQSYLPMISGAALVTCQIAEAMARRGHKVLVIAASDQSHPYLEHKQNLSIIRLRSYHNPLRVGQRFLLYPRREVMRALRVFRPDVIHTHDPLQMGLLGIEYAKRVHVPVTLTIHQLPWFVASYLPTFSKICVETLLWMYARWLSRQFTSIITPTETISGIVEKVIGLPVNTIGYGLDFEVFHPPLSSDAETATRQKWNLPPCVPLVLHVGRLDTDKHVDRVIAAAALSMARSDAHLLIVGDGVQKPALMKQCQSLGIADRTHFPGFISVQDGLPDIYRAASVFVTASEIETQGIVLLEAAATGLPIAAVRATCIPEIVQDGLNGYLAEPGDLHGLGNAVDLLLKHPRKAGQMGMAGRVLAEKHNLHSTFDLHEQFYRQMVRQLRMQRRAKKLLEQPIETR